MAGSGPRSEVGGQALPSLLVRRFVERTPFDLGLFDLFLMVRLGLWRSALLSTRRCLLNLESVGFPVGSGTRKGGVKVLFEQLEDQSCLGRDGEARAGHA